jgi:hypothetical protein
VLSSNNHNLQNKGRALSQNSSYYIPHSILNRTCPIGD